jgi:hypothetical protein
MPDNSGQAEIRGINIDKVLKGFEDEAFILRKYVSVTSTSAREVRWYQKTAGILDALAPAYIESDHLAKPTVIEQSFTRNTSFVKIWIVESPMMSIEDINDSDIDILATNLRDLTRAVANKEEKHIYNVLTENDTPSTINTNASTAAWNAGSGQDPIEDIMEAKENIRTYGYDPEGAILLLSPKDHKSLLTWLITTKGSSIPNFSSNAVGSGVVMEILGLKVVVSTVVTADKALVFVPQRACTLKEFVPITSAVITDEGIGKKIRIWLESIALLTDSRACNLITNTQV